jgi:hypothetical protein
MKPQHRTQSKFARDMDTHIHTMLAPHHPCMVAMVMAALVA